MSAVTSFPGDPSTRVPDFDHANNAQCPARQVCTRYSQRKRYEVRKLKTYDAVELAPLVSLWPPGGVLALARAELSEVLGGLGDHVFEELEGYPAERLAYSLQLEFVH